MNGEYKYYEFDPGQAVVYLLNETIGNSKLSAVSSFLSPNSLSPDMYSCIKGNFKKVGRSKPFDLPTRDNENQQSVEIRKLSQTPKSIQNLLKPQKTLYNYSFSNDYVVQLNFVNLKDDGWDGVYILIDTGLVDSIKGKLKYKQASKKASADQLNEMVQLYFDISFSMLNEFVQIEYKKYQFFDEITSTLERTISSKNKLADEIADLKNAHKSGLENKIAQVLQEKSEVDGPKIRLSENAESYVLNYQGDEDILIKAVAEAVDLVKKMYALNRAPNLEIDLNYIQINMEDDEKQGSTPNKKRKEKARFYLDKYEDAATLALKFKNKVNIKNIAVYTQPKAVQPPAISANVGKYKNEIRYLLLSYPQKWMVLRTNFGPISSIIDSTN